jgi:hypothetical protein
MKLCDYNWNLITFGILRQTTAHTVNIGITTGNKSIRFIITNDNGGEVWLDKDLGTSAYKLDFGFFTGSGDFAVNYAIYDIRKIEIEFHSRGW